MSLYNNHAVIDVAQWVSAELFTSGVFAAADYQNIAGFIQISPVFPIQQAAEMNNVIGERAFIVYDFIPIAAKWDINEIIRENMMFTCYSTNYGKVLEMQNLLVDLFRRNDRSAADLNTYLVGYTNNRFLSFEIADALPPDPMRDEGGRYGATVNIEYDFTRHVKSDRYYGSGAGRFAL
jgi:hypothetical protein